MKRYFKLLSVFLAIVILACICTTTYADEYDCKKYKDFVYVDDEMYFDGIAVINYTGKSKKIAIPSKIDGKDVTLVFGFEKAKTVKTIKIPATVASLYVTEAPALKKVIINKNNENYIFKDNLVLDKKGDILKSCPGGLVNVTVPGYIKEISRSAFSGSKKLKSVTVKQGIKVIPDSFENCKKLETVKLPIGLKELNKSFDGCERLAKVTIGNTKTVPKIRKDTFDDTKTGISFFVKNKKLAEQLKKNLKKSGASKANIYVGKKLIYKNLY